MIDLLALLLQEPSRVAEIPPAEVPALLGKLERLRATLWARLTTPASGNAHPEPPPEDHWLTAEEVAPLLGVTPRWLYRHWKRLPFTRRLSRKALRFSEAGLRRWQAAKRA